MKSALALAAGLALVAAYERGRRAHAAIRLAGSNVRVTIAAHRYAYAAIAGDRAGMESAARVLREEGLPW